MIDITNINMLDIMLGATVFIGAIFGFYLLNNSVKFPSRNEPIQNFDDLLGIEKRRSIRRLPDKEGFGWRLPIYEFRF